MPGLFFEFLAGSLVLIYNTRVKGAGGRDGEKP